MDKSARIWTILGILVGLMTISVILKFRDIVIILKDALA